MSSPDDAEWWEIRAGEYVIGTLDASARDLFARTLRSDSGLQASVRAWEKRFAALDRTVTPQIPPERVWHAIEGRLFTDDTPLIDVGEPEGDRQDGGAPDGDASAARIAGAGALAERTSGVVDLDDHRRSRDAEQQRGRLAPLVAALATAAALIMGVMLNQQYSDMTDARQLVETQFTRLEQQRSQIDEQTAALDTLMRTQGVSVIMGDDGQPLWLVQADFETERVRVTALQPPLIDADEDFQLWQVLPDGSGVHPVALLPDNGGRSLESAVPGLAERFDAFAVSLEPEGGSPEAGPTGAVLYQGEVVLTE